MTSLSYDQKLRAINEAWTRLRSEVVKYYPALWPQTQAFLATIVSVALTDQPLPLALIASGPSGSGKTEPLSWILKANDSNVYRADNFTPKSFVSHASNVKADKLKDIDMLPKIKDKIMITKELSPLFRGREDELRSTFAMLTTILDGQGYISNSGTQGQRGYSESINFAWLGATTPVPKTTFNLMAGLGTRLFLFSTDCKRPDTTVLSAIIGGRNIASEGNNICCNAMKRYLEVFFTCFQSRSLSINEFLIPEKLCAEMAIYCEIMTHLRGGLSLSKGKEDDEVRHGCPEIEHGYRAAQVVRAFLVGSALSNGRMVVNETDVGLVKHICLSSMPEYRRKVFETCLLKGGSITAKEIADITGMAKKTALHYGNEIVALGVFDRHSDSEPYIFEINTKFVELLTFTHTPTDQETAKTDSVTRIDGVCVEPTSSIERNICEVFPGAKVVN